MHRLRVMTGVQFSFEDPKLMILADQCKPEAEALAEKLAGYRARNPDAIVTIGGDGFMLQTIRKQYHRRIPFLGLNVGHVGFLLNEPTDIFADDQFALDYQLYELPLLDVTFTMTNGKVVHEVAFNDAWVDRTSPQTAWMEVKVNDRIEISKLVADGLLLATPAGSTAYARAMGAVPVPVNAQLIVMVGKNVAFPNWKSANLPTSTEVEISCLDPKKRPISGFVDGKEYRSIQKMNVRVSPSYRVQLLFHERQTLGEKLARVQFPNHVG